MTFGQMILLWTAKIVAPFIILALVFVVGTVVMMIVEYRKERKR